MNPTTEEKPAHDLAQLPVPEVSRDDVERSLEIQGANARASWNFSADGVQQALRHTTPERKEVLLWCLQHCLDNGIYMDEFATRVDYSRNTLYKIFTGKHIAPGTGERYDIPDKLYQAALDFRKAERSKALDTDGEFVITPTVRRIWNACDQARASHTPVFIYGASHIGKTWSLSRYTYENNHGRTGMVRIPSSSGLGGMVDAIAQRVGISEKANTKEKIIRIKKAIGSNYVLILDEVHQLIYTYRRESFFNCLEVIRDIYDATGCGMVLCTTNVFRNELESAQKTNLEQLFRRGVHRVQLGDIVLQKDLKVILDHFGLPWPTPKMSIEIAGVTDQPYEVLRKLSREEGLKSITERIRYARILAEKANQQLEWRHFIHAHIIIEKNAQAPLDDWQ